MDEQITRINEWMKAFSEYELPAFEHLPDLDLYMDQVISYIEKKLDLFSVSESDKVITSFMINNYVKAELVKPPVSKKYSREQIGYFFAICAVKQILSMQEIKLLFNMDEKVSPDKDKLYEFFRQVQSDNIQHASKAVQNKIDIITRRYNSEVVKDAENAAENARANLANVAFKLAIEAEINKLMANRIIYEINQSLKQEHAKKEKHDDSKKQVEQEGKKKKKHKEKKENQPEVVADATPSNPPSEN